MKIQETNLTKLEKTVLIAFLPAQNVGDSGEGATFVNDIGNDIWESQKIDLSVPQIKGIISSLQNKKLVTIDGAVYMGDCFRDNQELLDEMIQIVNN